MKGLMWLARVGPSPLDPWRFAMGWSEVAARNHARRLEKMGWLERVSMVRGEGSLFFATRTGVRMLGLPLIACTTPAPTWWSHHIACAWTAAWLKVRGRDFLGPPGADFEHRLGLSTPLARPVRRQAIGAPPPSRCVRCQRQPGRDRGRACREVPIQARRDPKSPQDMELQQQLERRRLHLRRRGGAQSHRARRQASRALRRGRVS
jgi:hypothetical protein